MPTGKDFKKTTQDAWRREAEKGLNGKSFRESLFSLTEEGLTLKALYFDTDRQDLPVIPGTQTWHISQTLFCDNDDFNKQALEVLQQGQTALNINLNTASQLDRSYPRSVSTVRLDAYSDYKALFKKMDPQRLVLFFNAYGSAHKLYPWSLKWCYENNRDAVALNIAFGCDPVSAALIYGGFAESLSGIIEGSIDVLKNQKQHPGLDLFTIHADIIHNSGGHKIQQLAYILGLITTYVNMCMQQGIEPAVTLSALRIKMAVGNAQFMEIAKLRALRLLWNNVCSAYQIKEVDAKVDIVTSWRWLSDRDIYNNMLRAAGQAFAAIIGGCHSLDVLPFDLALKLPDEFSLRQARNLQIILAREAHLNKVQDPAAGSYFLDKVSVELAQKSWQTFRKMEKKGGLINAIRSGSLQSEIKANALKQEQEIASGSRKAIGVNCYQVDDTGKKGVNDYYYHQQKLYTGIEPLVLKRVL